MSKHSVKHSVKQDKAYKAYRKLDSNVEPCRVAVDLDGVLLDTHGPVSMAYHEAMRREVSKNQFTRYMETNFFNEYMWGRTREEWRQTMKDRLDLSDEQIDRVLACKDRVARMYEDKTVLNEKLWFTLSALVNYGIIDLFIVSSGSECATKRKLARLDDAAIRNRVLRATYQLHWSAPKIGPKAGRFWGLVQPDVLLDDLPSVLASAKNSWPSVAAIQYVFKVAYLPQWEKNNGLDINREVSKDELNARYMEERKSLHKVVLRAIAASERGGRCDLRELEANLGLT